MLITLKVFLKKILSNDLLSKHRDLKLKLAGYYNSMTKFLGSKWINYTSIFFIVSMENIESIVMVRALTKREFIARAMGVHGGSIYLF